MARKKKPTYHEPSLFDEPLQLPPYQPEELVDCDTFLLDAKVTNGLIMKINRNLMEKVAAGQQPNFHLSKYLSDLTKNINQSILSYSKLVEMETQRTDDAADAEITLIP